MVDKAVKYNISTGRGGAGNIHKSDSKASPKIVPQGSQTPNIIHPVYSTGRGGAGNMRKNLDPKLTRRAQDVEETESDENDLIDQVMDESVIDNEDCITPLHAGSLPLSTSNNSRCKTNMDSPLSRQSTNTYAVPEKTKSRKLRRHSSSHEPPQAIMIGRGGAGNIMSRTSSKISSHSGNSDTKRKQKRKRGLWSSIKNIFTFN